MREDHYDLINLTVYPARFSMENAVHTTTKAPMTMDERIDKALSAMEEAHKAADTAYYEEDLDCEEILSGVADLIETARSILSAYKEVRGQLVNLDQVRELVDR